MSQGFAKASVSLSSMTLDSLILTSLTASLPVVSDASKYLVSLAYTGATSFRKNLGLETDDSPTHAGLTLTAFSGAVIATAGVLSAGTLAATLGGTGQTVYAVGDLLYAPTTTTLGKLADVAAGAYLRSGGVSTAPLWSTLILPNAATVFRLPVATSANTIGELAAVGATGEYLAGVTGAIPVWATLNQAAVAGLTTASSPAFAGLTLTAFSGVLKATAGVLSGSAVHSDLGSIGANDHHNAITLDVNAETLLSLSTQALGLDTQTANYVFAGPATAPAAVPTFRALVDADIPDTITLTNITQVTNRSHTSLSDIGTLSHATIDTYLDQAVKQASSPVFASVNALTLTAAAVGFTIAGGTTSKTLTVDETVALSAKAPLISPSFTTPALGTPASGTLTSCTGLPAAGVVGTAAVVADVIKGDGTAGRVFRSVNITVDDGTTAAHIKCTTGQIWNGDVHAQSDEFAANETSPDGFWSLDDSGSVLRLLDAGLTGNAIGVLAATLKTNLTGITLMISLSLSGGIFAQIRNATTGAYLDITTLVDTGSFSFIVFYVTSE
jgi:hypothetical protein